MYVSGSYLGPSVSSPTLHAEKKCRRLLPPRLCAALPTAAAASAASAFSSSSRATGPSLTESPTPQARRRSRAPPSTVRANAPQRRSGDGSAPPAYPRPLPSCTRPHRASSFPSPTQRARLMFRPPASAVRTDVPHGGNTFLLLPSSPSTAAQPQFRWWTPEANTTDQGKFRLSCLFCYCILRVR